MRKSVRLVGLMAGTALVAFLGSSCAENPLFVSQPDTASATIVDRALNAARVARANGDLNAAASKLAYLVSIAPDNAAVLSEYGKVLTEMGRPDDALGYFKKAMALNADDWKIYNAEGVAYDEKHDFEAARADYMTALKLNPGSTAVLNNAARSRMMAGDLVGAEALLAQARPTAQENGYFTSTQAKLSELELKSNPNAPVAALTPRMDVQAPAMPPESAPTLPVEVRKVPPAATAAPREIDASTPAQRVPAAPVVVAQAPAPPAPPIVAQPATSATAAKDAALETAPPARPQIATVPTPAAEPAAAPVLPSATTTVASSTDSAAANATPAAPPEPAPPVVAKTAEAQPAQQAPLVTPVSSAPPAPVVEAAASPAQTASPTPTAQKIDMVASSDHPITATRSAESTPAPVVEAPKPAPVVAPAKLPEVAAPVQQAPAAPVVAAQAPAAPASAIVGKPVLSAAAMREAALEAGIVPPQSAASPAAASTAPAAAPLASAPSVATAETLYIRIGTFRSRMHARQVAQRLRGHRLAENLSPSDVHVVRLTWHGRRWYRVWIRGAGERPQVQDELASVHSLGYLHARIIAKVETARHLAQSSAPTVVASSGR